MGEQLPLFGAENMSVEPMFPREVVENAIETPKKRPGRPRKQRTPDALPMAPAPAHIEQQNLEQSVEIQHAHLHGSVFVNQTMATQLIRGKNNVQEMQLMFSSGMLRICFSASADNRASTIYLPPGRWAQLTERT